VQLVEISDQFEAMGLEVVTMTYDSVDFLKTVEEDQGVEFTLLHDEEVSHVNNLGIRNLDYDLSHRAYGIPYPGIFLLDHKGVIQAKFAEESYRDRPDFANILEAATNL
jgi:peroxiredoxin